jgi:hypothetical protein
MIKARENQKTFIVSQDDKLRLTPFAKCGETTSIVGYRDDSSGIVVASVELPTELIERSILANVSIEITLSGSGEVTSAASNTASGSSSSIKTISLDDLVDMLLDCENIHMEETTENELRILLETLQKSVRAVQRAIATLNPAAS